MTYTIEQLEVLIREYEKQYNDAMYKGVITGDVYISVYQYDLAQQLLTALREIERLQARIDAALAIPQRTPWEYSSDKRLNGQIEGANRMRKEFRAALGEGHDDD